MTSYGRMTKTKAVYLKELYNFEVWQPFHLKSFSRKTVFEFLTFKIIFLNGLDGESTKTKIVGLDDIYNFVVENFFI